MTFENIRSISGSRHAHQAQWRWQSAGPGLAEAQGLAPGNAIRSQHATGWAASLMPSETTWEFTLGSFRSLEWWIFRGRTGALQLMVLRNSDKKILAADQTRIPNVTYQLRFKDANGDYSVYRREIRPMVDTTIGIGVGHGSNDQQTGRGARSWKM
jgi:hypothetical protein